MLWRYIKPEERHHQKDQRPHLMQQLAIYFWSSSQILILLRSDKSTAQSGMAMDPFLWENVEEFLACFDKSIAGLY